MTIVWMQVSIFTVSIRFVAPKLKITELTYLAYLISREKLLGEHVIISFGLVLPADIVHPSSWQRLADH